MTADIEAIVVAALYSLGVEVVTSTPNPRPDSFVRVVAAGGPAKESRVIDWADVAWEAWAPTSTGAAGLAGRVRDAFDDMAGESHAGAFVADSSSTRPRWFPDDTSETPRYVGQARILIHTI